MHTQIMPRSLNENRDAIRRSLALSPEDFDSREPLWRERFAGMAELGVAIAQHKHDTGDLLSEIDVRLYSSPDLPHVAIARHRLDADGMYTHMDERLYAELERLLRAA